MLANLPNLYNSGNLGNDIYLTRNKRFFIII